MKRILTFTKNDVTSLGKEGIRNLIMLDVDDCIDALFEEICEGIKVQTEIIYEGVVIP